ICITYFFQAEDGIRVKLVTGVRRVLFRSVRRALEEAGVHVTSPPRLDFRDPWGNFVQVVDYRDIQFTKAPEILRGMSLDGLDKRSEERRVGKGCRQREEARR